MTLYGYPLHSIFTIYDFSGKAAKIPVALVTREVRIRNSPDPEQSESGTVRICGVCLMRVNSIVWLIYLTIDTTVYK